MRAAIVTFTDVLARAQSSLPRLRTHASLAQFAALLDGGLCAGLRVHVEDYSKWLLLEDVVIRSLEYVDEYMSQPKCGEIESAFLSTFVNDVLIFGCITISKTSNERPNSLHPGQYPFEKEMNRMSIQVLSGEMMSACLSELCFCLARRPMGVNLASASLLSHIKVEEYTTAMPIAQRMLLVSLCNLSLHLRTSLLCDPLFVRMRSSAQLIAWMLACSGSDEQYFLNTCDTASSCVSIIARHSSICSLLVLARTVMREIRSQSNTLSDSEPAFPSIFPRSVPSVRSYTTACSKEAERLFNNIELQASQLLLLDTQTTINTVLQDTNLQEHQNRKDDSWNLPISSDLYITKLFKLTKEWNHAMQVLSSIFAPSSPIVLTRKPFSERWHLSALVMWLLCSMTKYVPGQPTSQARTRSSHEISQIRPHLYHTFRTQVTHYEDNCIFHDFAYRVRTSEPKEQSKLIKFLWKKTIKRGGIMFSSREYVQGVGLVGHLNVLFACILPNSNYVQDGADTEEILTEVKKKLFLIADPEICNFKVLTFLQMFEILCNENYNFNLLDVGKAR